jgi:peroxiredoxin (alkyl hydroperoxide reductase subunit C)
MATSIIRATVGKVAPFFKSVAYDSPSKGFKEISLDDYKNKYLLLFFYPLDFTFVCPT